MKITDIKTQLLRVPVETALVNQTKSQPFMEVVLVTVETDEGFTGHGYSYTDGFGGHGIKAVLDHDIRQLLLGKNPLEVRFLSKFLLWELRQAGFAGITVLAAAGVDLALWDIASLAANMPIVKLLGQYRDKIPMYASVAGWNGLPVEEMVERAQELVVGQKMLGVKIQVGRGTPEQDARRLRMLRETLGSETRLFIDANTILDLPTAVRLGKRLEEYDVFWMEEPLPLRETENHRLLAEQIHIPLATGENFFGIHDCDEFINQHLVSYIQADVIRVGGISEWMRVASFCDAKGIRISPHFLMEITTHVQCCVPNSLFVEYIPWFQKLFKEPLHTQDGFAFPRTVPGLGLEFREDVIAKDKID